MEEKKNRPKPKLGSETDDGGAVAFEFYPNSGRSFAEEHGLQLNSDRHGQNREFSFNLKREQ